MKISKSPATSVVALLWLIALLFALPSQPANAQARKTPGLSEPIVSYEAKKSELSDIAVTIVTSGLTCTCARFASDIQHVVNDLRPGGLRVLPVLGVGGLQTVQDILFLRGIDMGVVDEDNLRLLKERDPRLYANIDQRVQFITRLYNNEFHVVARKEIKGFGDLRGKTVSFNLKDSQTEVTSQAIFSMLKLDVKRVNLDNNQAIKKLREGEIAAMIVVSGAPQSAISRIKKEDEFHFLPLDERSLPDMDLGPIFEYYLRARLTHKQYPTLIPEGETVPTVANRALLAVYNWPENHPRYSRLAKFVDTFFDSIYQFHDGSRHPKWKEINLAAEVPGWTRFKPAAEWLERNRGALSSRGGQATANLKPMFEQFVASYTASTGKRALSPREMEALFGEFRRFLETQVTAQKTQ